MDQKDTDPLVFDVAETPDGISFVVIGDGGRPISINVRFKGRRGRPNKALREWLNIYARYHLAYAQSGVKTTAYEALLDDAPKGYGDIRSAAHAVKTAEQRIIEALGGKFRSTFSYIPVDPASNAFVMLAYGKAVHTIKTAIAWESAINSGLIKAFMIVTSRQTGPRSPCLHAGWLNKIHIKEMGADE